MTPKNLICLKCKNMNQIDLGCKAFPDGIPEEIKLGTNNHKKPLKGQGNDIVFEKE